MENQKARDEIAESGELRRRPARIQMVGPDRFGRLLTIILEHPDDDGIAHIVTGWVANKGQQTRYRNAKGRRR